MARPEVTGKRIQRWFTKRQLADRYNVCTRTIERWVERKTFPPGTPMPNGRDQWPDIVVEAHERASVGARQLPDESAEAPQQACTAA